MALRLQQAARPAEMDDSARTTVRGCAAAGDTNRPMSARSQSKGAVRLRTDASQSFAWGGFDDQEAPRAGGGSGVGWGVHGLYTHTRCG